MEPLAARTRPQLLNEVVGQEHLIGKGKPLQVAIEKKHKFSFILWGPPGTGKTTIARIYARTLNTELFELSAVSAGKNDIRKLIETKMSKEKILFLDEIHRFNKTQQDFLLPYVENGTLFLIGATTENPSFEIIAPLLSRCHVFILKPLSEASLEHIIKRTALKVPTDALKWLLGYANGDARRALGMLEIADELYGAITVEALDKALESPHLRYDKKGEEHYDTTSAFIKSMRASQRDAAIYYLARMIEAGEDPLFIARRMIVFASEDIGMAQPTALVVANAIFRACETIGYPECAISLAHGASYLADAKKNRNVYDALRVAQEDVRTFGNLPLPKKVCNPVTKLMKEFGYGKDYKKYDTESYLPEKLKKKKYFE